MGIALLLTAIIALAGLDKRSNDMQNRDASEFILDERSLRRCVRSIPQMLGTEPFKASLSWREWSIGSWTLR